MYELRTHPHVISLKEFCQDSVNYYIIEELAVGGELFDAIIRHENYSEREAQNLVRTLLYTLRYCHEKGVVHRDLKPENILLKSEDDLLNIKIADFGFATHVIGTNLVFKHRQMDVIHFAPSVEHPGTRRRKSFVASITGLVWTCGHWVSLPTFCK